MGKADDLDRSVVWLLGGKWVRMCMEGEGKRCGSGSGQGFVN